MNNALEVENNSAQRKGRTVYYLSLPQELAAEELQQIVDQFADRLPGQGHTAIVRGDLDELEVQQFQTVLMAPPGGSSNFQRVSAMNEAFGNPKGNPTEINWPKIRRQCKNIFDEFVELQKALGLNKAGLVYLKEVEKQMAKFTYYEEDVNVPGERDALCDIHVFAYGAHHLMGIDADRDMEAVVSGVMTRFIKDEHDKEATIALHASRGITDVYFEGEYPKMVMKSASDQPDAPRGKFLKSASYTDSQFYDVRSAG